MNIKQRLLAMLFLSLGTIYLVSCSKNDDFKLVDPFYKTLEISCGSDFEIPVLSNNWYIESVQEMPSGSNMLDKENNPLRLEGNGNVEAANGWLAFTRDQEGMFVMNLKENFDRLNERTFVICLNEAGRRDYVTVRQRAGTEYKLVKSEYKEIAEKREIYLSNKGCSNLILTNHLSQPVWEPSDYIFKDVVHSSEFESEDYGAFDWVPEQGVELSDVPHLNIDGYIRWSHITTYKKGLTTAPYIKDIPNGNKILMQPYTTTYLKGEITYCKRICNYTFTIENAGTGTRFNVNGVWTQVVPIVSHIIGSDKPE